MTFLTMRSSILPALVLGAFLVLVPTAQAYTYASPLTASSATTVSGKCSGALVATLGTASGTGALPAVNSRAWELLSTSYSGGLPSNYNNGSYCIQAAVTSTTGGGGGGRGGGGGTKFDSNYGAFDFFSFFSIPTAFAQTDSWQIVYTIHSGSGTATQSGWYALTYVGAVSTPTASLSASPSTISQGSSSALTWSSTNATSCAGTGFSTGNATSGTVSVSPSSTTTYSVTCTGTGGTSPQASKQVIVTSTVAAPVTTVSTSPSSIQTGESVTITWSSTNASYCSSSQFDTEGATSGSVTLTPSSTTTYTVTCTGTTGTGSGTWQYQRSDTSDLACPWTDPNRPYSALATCPSSNPQGTSCTNPPNTNCKVNSGYCNAVTTDVYSCVASSPSPSDSESVQVLVGGPVTALLSSTKTTVQAGETTTLTWSSSGSEYCVAQELPLDETMPLSDFFAIGSSLSGSDVVRPTSDTQYSIYCYGPNYNNGQNTGVWVQTSISQSGKLCTGGTNNILLTNCPSSFNEGGSCSPIGSTCFGGDPDEADLLCPVGGGVDYGSPRYECQATGGGGSNSCQPDAINDYNPTCNANYEVLDFSCPVGYRVDRAYEACRQEGAPNTRPFRDVVTCTPCGGGGSGSGSDTAYDTITITVNEPQCSDNEDNDLDGDVDGVDDGCTPGDPNDDNESDDPLVTATLDCTSPNSCSLPVNSTAILTWSSVNATTCVNTAGEGAGGFSTGGAPSGTDTTTAIADNATYQIQCMGPDGSDIDSADILVRVPVVDIFADAYRVATNGQTTVHWTSQNALSCSVSGPGFSSVLLNGEQSVTITKQQEYKIDCEGATKSIIINPTFNLQEF